MFGSSQPSVFGASTLPTFGTTNQNPFIMPTTFGPPISHQQPPHNPGPFGGAGLGFAQPAKPAGFPFPSQQPASSFGQQSNAFNPSPVPVDVFGQSSFSFAQNGTAFKYIPITMTDTVLKASGSTVAVNTRLCSISAMTQYIDKSFEELRLEDYHANRKGPQQTKAPLPRGNSTSSMFGLSDHSFASSGFGNQPIPQKPITTNTFNVPPANTNAFTLPPTYTNTYTLPTINSTCSNTFGINSRASTNKYTLPGNNTAGGNIFGGNTNNVSGNLFGMNPTTSFTIPAANTASSNIFGVNRPPNPASCNIFGVNHTTNANSSAPASNLFGMNAAKPSLFSTTNLKQPTNFGASFSSPAVNQTAFSFGQNNQNFNLQPQPSKSPSDAGGFNLNRPKSVNLLNQSSTPNFPGFNYFNKPAQSTQAQPQQKFSLLNTASNLNAIPSTIPLAQVTPPTLLAPRSPPNPLEAMRDMIRLTDPFGTPSHLNGLEYCTPEAYALSNLRDVHEGFGHVARETAPPANSTPCKATENVKQMHKLFDNLQCYPSDNLPRSTRRELHIRKTVPVTEPLVFFDDIGVQPKNSPSVSTLPTDDINADMLDLIKKHIAYGFYDENSDVSIHNLDSDETVLAGSSDVSNSSFTVVELPIPVAEPTCGIILTKPDYYTLPPIDEIEKYLNADGMCQVKGFTIGRVGYGNVYFPDTIDVTNLNLDRLVDIGYREITVYPDDDDRPEVGEGLNRRAQVTLDKVYPRRENGELETNPDNLRKRRYEDTLRIASARKDVDFVEYRPETGSWVFIVPHFSKYAFPDI